MTELRNNGSRTGGGGRYVLHRRRGRDSTRRGVAIVWVAILSVLLISLVGLAMDAGVVYLAGTHLQVAADAASLAGARVVRDDDPNKPRIAAYTLGMANKALGTPVSLDLNDDNEEDGEIVIGRFYRFADVYNDPQRCTEPPCFVTTETPNAVRVRARRVSGSTNGQVPLVFGKAPIINVVGVNVSRAATAMITGGTGAGVITLDPSGDCSLNVGGSVNLDLTSADTYNGDNAIQVNSDAECAFCVNGGENTEIHAPETNIVGSGGECNGSDIDGSPVIDTYINPDSPSMPDPLADYDPPPIGVDLGAIDPRDDVQTYYPPGYYSDGMKIGANQNVLLGPGIYVVEGTDNGSKGGFQTNGGILTAINVMIYVKSGKLDLGGNGTTTITPMNEDNNTNPDYIGIAIFQARDNLTPARIIGTANMTLEGTYYFPSNRLNVSGTGIALGNQLIAWQLDLQGNGIFSIQYDGRFPSPGSKVLLVE